MRLRFIEGGAGPLVLLLHGFPDGPMTWRFQRDAIAGAGYRVVMPWLRGYGRSSRPADVRAYGIDRLIGDARGLIDRLGDGRAAAVVGHDWGGVIGWHLAARTPRVMGRLVILNAPHPAAFARELRRPRQLARSVYAFFFQIPWLPERVLRAGDFAVVRRAIGRMLERRDAFGEEDWRAIRDGLAEPGALHGALNYYRAAARARRRGRVGTIELPTLLLWGMRDRALGPRLSHGLERRVQRIEVRRYDDAGHWVHWDRPADITRDILQFLGEGVQA